MHRLAALALLALLLLLAACATPPVAAYGVTVRRRGRGLSQKQEEEPGSAANSDGPPAKRAAPAAAATPVDDPADWPPAVLDLLGGYLDNKDLVKIGEGEREGQGVCCFFSSRARSRPAPSLFMVSQLSLSQTARLHAIAARCSAASARTYTIGSSTKGAPLTVLELTVPPPPGVEPEALPPRAHVQYTGALHGDEPTGRQLLAALAEYICADVEAAEKSGGGGGGGGGGDDAGRRRRRLAKAAEDGDGDTDAPTGADDLLACHPGVEHHPHKPDAAAAGRAQPAAPAATKQKQKQAGGRDPRVAALGAAAITLHLLPAANPDGFALHRRENEAGIDLNRDFPDPLDRAAGVLGLAGTPPGRLAAPAVEALAAAAPTADLSPSGTEQPETAALMAWLTAPGTPFAAAAALHEGAVVANYPWDGTPEMGTRYAASPDDATFRWAATAYAARSPSMVTSAEFAATAGTTNGAAWYPLRGGMQDWAYLAGGALELTLELSEAKWPPPAALPGLAADNWAALLEWPAAVVGGGARGRVVVGGGGGRDLPPNVTIALVGVPGAPPVRTGPDGGWARPLAPGTWTLVASAPGGWTSPALEVTVPGDGGPGPVLTLTPPVTRPDPAKPARPPPPPPARSPGATFTIAASAIARQRAGSDPERGGGGGLGGGGAGSFGAHSTALIAAQSAFALGAGLTLVIVVRSAAVSGGGGRSGGYGGGGGGYVQMIPV